MQVVEQHSVNSENIMVAELTMQKELCQAVRKEELLWDRWRS